MCPRFGGTRHQTEGAQARPWPGAPDLATPYWVLSAVDRLRAVSSASKRQRAALGKVRICPGFGPCSHRRGRRSHRYALPWIELFPVFPVDSGLFPVPPGTEKLNPIKGLRLFSGFVPGVPGKSGRHPEGKREKVLPRLTWCGWIRRRKPASLGAIYGGLCCAPAPCWVLPHGSAARVRNEPESALAWHERKG